MEGEPLTFVVLLPVFIVFQMIVTAWSYRANRSAILAMTTFLMPLILAVGWTYLTRLPSWAVMGVAVFAMVPLGLNIWLRREDLKDNQVAGMVTYIGVVLGVAWFLKVIPADEMPWVVIHTMSFFAGLGLLNLLDVAVAMRLKSDG